MPTTQEPLHTPYPLDPTAVRHFDDQGFVKLPGVLDPATVDSYEPEITSKVIELNTQHLPLEERNTYGKAFLQVTNLWQHSRKVRELVFSPRLAGIAAALLGVESVRLYHDQALYKEPGGGITPWHADQYYWPLSTDRTVTVWLPLQETPADMGPLAFAAGSHRFELGRDLPISDDSERELQAALSGRGFPLVETPYRLGDASFHSGWTFHRASPNHSGAARRVMTIIYMDADITATEPTNEFQRADLREWLPGTEIGSVPSSHLNPVLHP
jgi:ectoine hydroxylase-related dioxygenase (phytanoyl-CoA dioxygenase family)